MPFSSKGRLSLRKPTFPLDPTTKNYNFDFKL